MATAMEVTHLEPAACAHAAFNPYRTRGGGLDDMTSEKGRCPECEAWLEITTFLSSGYSEERALDADEIRELRREVLA